MKFCRTKATRSSAWTSTTSSTGTPTRSARARSRREPCACSALTTGAGASDVRAGRPAELDTVNWSPTYATPRSSGVACGTSTTGRPGAPARPRPGRMLAVVLENIPAFGEHHRVIAVDLPGFGHSESLPAPAEMATHADRWGAARALGWSGRRSSPLDGRPHLAGPGDRPPGPRRAARAGQRWGRTHRADPAGPHRACVPGDERGPRRPEVMWTIARRAGCAGRRWPASWPIPARCRRSSRPRPSADAAPGFLDAVVAAAAVAGRTRPRT